MKRKLLRIGIVSLMTVLLLPSLGCAKMVKKLKKKVSNPFVHSNYPYDPDTPAPAPHDGTFVSDHGTMTFNGDGESVIIDFDKALAEAVWLPAGRQEASYQFLSGDIPPHRKIPIRYDVAMYISITVDDSSSVLAVGLVGENGSKSTGTGCTTADRITFIDVELDGRPGVNFVKTADAAPRLSPATVKESDMPPTVCNGTWNGKSSSVHFVSDMGNVDLTDFYISADGDAEYAVGTFSWSSGEQDYFAMMRGKAAAGKSKDEVLLSRAKKRSGAPEAELEWNPDGTATIHLFETVDDGDGDSHISTWDWYTIDPATMTGTDFMEMPVDLN